MNYTDVSLKRLAMWTALSTTEMGTWVSAKVNTKVENNNEPVGILEVHLSPGLLSCTNKASSKTARNTDYLPSRRKVLVDLGGKVYPSMRKMFFFLPYFLDGHANHVRIRGWTAAMRGLLITVYVFTLSGLYHCTTLANFLKDILK